MCVQLLTTALSLGSAYYGDAASGATGADKVQAAQSAQAFATAADALGNYSMSQARAAMSRADAAAEMASGQERARRIRKLGADALGETRSSAVASGVKLTSESVLQAELATVRASEQDAGLAIVTGNNRAAGLNASAAYYQAAGFNALSDGLIEAGSKWKRSRGPVDYGAISRIPARQMNPAGDGVVLNPMAGP